MYYTARHEPHFTLWTLLYPMDPHSTECIPTEAKGPSLYPMDPHCTQWAPYCIRWTLTVPNGPTTVTNHLYCGDSCIRQGFFLWVFFPWRFILPIMEMSKFCFKPLDNSWSIESPSQIRNPTVFLKVGHSNYYATKDVSFYSKHILKKRSPYTGFRAF